MIFPCWLCREILKLFLVVLLRVVFRLYEGRGVGVHKYLIRHLGEPWAVSCDRMVMGEVVTGLSLGS